LKSSSAHPSAASMMTSACNQAAGDPAARGTSRRTLAPASAKRSRRPACRPAARGPPGRLRLRGGRRQAVFFARVAKSLSRKELAPRHTHASAGRPRCITRVAAGRHRGSDAPRVKARCLLAPLVLMEGARRRRRRLRGTCLKVRDLIRLIETRGWYLARTRGDHRQYRHPIVPGVVTVSGHPGDDVMKKTLVSVLRQAGLKGR
jgi:predicted RNA binding protein YcfA (HicA-like mRNA interferase family)